jgi:hypothetical protein
VKGIVKLLTNLLGSDELSFPRIVLRTLKCLCMKNEEFQMDLIRAGILKKTVPLLRNSEAETSFWALVYFALFSSPILLFIIIRPCYMTFLAIVNQFFFYWLAIPT